MASGERKFTLYTNGKRVRDIPIQHEKEEQEESLSFYREMAREMGRKDYERRKEEGTL